MELADRSSSHEALRDIPPGDCLIYFVGFELTSINFKFQLNDFAAAVGGLSTGSAT